MILPAARPCPETRHMRSTWFFLIVGLALVLGPSLGNSQFGPQGGGGAGGFGGGGFGGGGFGGGALGGASFGGGGGMAMDPTALWNTMANGKQAISRNDITNPMMQGWFDRIAQQVGSSNGQ